MVDGSARARTGVKVIHVHSLDLLRSLWTTQRRVVRGRRGHADARMPCCGPCGAALCVRRPL